MSELARYIDHTLLKPEATRAQIEQLCAEAAEHQFASVCVNGSRVELAYSLLEESEVQVCTVVGFPLGAMDADAKRYETEAAVDTGAQEIDMVMNVGRFRDGEHDYIVREIRDVVEAADDRTGRDLVRGAARRIRLPDNARLDARGLRARRPGEKRRVRVLEESGRRGLLLLRGCMLRRGLHFGDLLPDEVAERAKLGALWRPGCLRFEVGED